MKLLMITRKVDRQDHLAGFTYNWVKKIGESLNKSGGKLTVICLQKGDTKGLENTKIYSLNKNPGKNKLSSFFKFQKLAWQLVPRSDGVFCHMNPEYTIAVAPAAKFFRKKIVSWYVHQSVTLRLRILEKLANKILTTNRESFNLQSKKVQVVGHGIDTATFKPGTPESNPQLSLLSIGRISPSKDIESMIKAVDILKDRGQLVTLKIIGGPGLPGQQTYFDSLKKMIKAMNLEAQVEMTGAIAHQNIVPYLQSADIFVNLSKTGLDKAVLEAMACECLVITSSAAIKSTLPGNLIIKKDRPDLLAIKIDELNKMSLAGKAKLKTELREIVVKNHNLDNLVGKIIASFGV